MKNVLKGVRLNMKRFLSLTVLFTLSATTSLLHAQTLTTQIPWQRIAPTQEGFTVLMPTSALAGTRRIPLGEREWIPGRVYYSLANDKRYIVLSLAKTSPDKFPGLSSFEEFVAGIERAFKSMTRAEFENKVTGFSALADETSPAQHPFKQYQVTLGKYSGVARLLARETAFYALMVVGADGSDAEAKRFLESFESSQKNVDAANVTEDYPYVGTDIKLKAALPSEPWPTPCPPINGGILNAKADRLPPQKYPRGSRDSGAVVIQILVDEQGKVIAAEPVSGPESLRTSALEAAKKSTFKPTRLSGQPIKVSGVLVYRFVFQG
jgi:TonB family protein